jgi:hypothetical protein
MKRERRVLKTKFYISINRFREDFNHRIAKKERKKVRL